MTKYRVRVLQLPFEIRSDTRSLHLKYFVIELLFFVKIIRNLLFLYFFVIRKENLPQIHTVAVFLILFGSQESD